jgi:glycosyltransferase involved in cell wall biosynthesis
LGKLAYSKFILESHITRMIGRSFRLLTPSHATKMVLTKAWGEPIDVLPNAVALKDLGSPAARHGPLRAFFGGRIVPEKGLDLLYESMKENRDTLLSVSGSGRRSYLPALDNLARELGVESDRREWRPRDEYLDRLRDFDFCVIPSRGFEVFGMVALDAEMAGLPLVLADQGGLREVGAPGKNALFFERGSRESLSRAISEMAADEELRSRFSRMSKRIVRARFTMEEHLDSLIDLYQKALGEEC